MVVCRFFQQGHCRYGQSCRFEHIYGSKYTYRAPQTQNERNDEVFHSGMRQGSSNNVASSVFRSAVQNISAFNNAPNNSSFAQNPQSRGTVFDRLGPPQNPSGAFQNNQAKSIFAQANQSAFAQPPLSRNVFQTHNQDSAKSIFAQASQNIFGSTQSGYFNQPRDTAANLFARAAQSLPNDPFNQQTSSPFSNAQQPAQNVFQISDKSPSNVFSVTMSAFDQNNDENIYSKLEDLSKSDLEAFESLDFKLGFIPELPPPKSLCV